MMSGLEDVQSFLVMDLESEGLNANPKNPRPKNPRCPYSIVFLSRA